MDTKDAFSRLDESDDGVFYATDRFVSHLDAVALDTVERVVGELVTEERPVILDLMAGWDSHIPARLSPAKVVGLGLSENELRQNQALTEFVIHDLNREPHLPFPDNTFDCVINTVSVDYMTRPVEVFADVARILKPGGLFLVVFSNRMFPQKAVKVWRGSSDEERTILVEEFFERAGAFEKPRHFASTGKPRPRDDKYAPMGIPSDPIYAVYAEKRGGIETKQRPKVTVEFKGMPDEGELERRKMSIKDTLRCPYCNERMRKWAVPDNPFTQTWDNEFMHICFNDECPYFVRGWDHMHAGGNRGISYRLMYNPIKDVCKPVPVPTHLALKEGIVD
jgi:SAM-dependent methyltransferase